MPTYYTVDAAGGYTAGMVLGLMPLRAAPSRSSYVMEQARLLHGNYAGGVTHHGNRYLGGPGANIWCEIVAELVRLYEFPDRLSRFQAVFATETLEGAQEFRAKYRRPEQHPNARIWKVEGDAALRADMMMLPEPPFGRAVVSARHYWRGETAHPTPFWEVLLRPPVTVLSPVD